MLAYYFISAKVGTKSCSWLYTHIDTLENATFVHACIYMHVFELIVANADYSVCMTAISNWLKLAACFLAIPSYLFKYLVFSHIL